MRASSPEEAFRRYDELGARHVEVLRRLTKQIQDARIARDNEAIKRAINEYDEALEAYIPGEGKGGRRRKGEGREVAGRGGLGKQERRGKLFLQRVSVTLRRKVNMLDEQVKERSGGLDARHGGGGSHATLQGLMSMTSIDWAATLSPSPSPLPPLSRQA